MSTKKNLSDLETGTAEFVAHEERLNLHADALAKPFPHFWAKTFGSCHASITLCEDWRKDLEALQKIVDVEYIRFHGIFDKETGIFAGKDQNGNLVLNFTRIDLIYDGLVSRGVRPFVELSFMPVGLADDIEGSIHPFKYSPIVAPPKDPTKWYELTYKFIEHVVARYGIEEVAKWWFEVWNEPNIDFLAGANKKAKQEAYFQMYHLAAQAIKKVSARLRVGGPATAMAAWIPDFITHCVENNIPLDFVSTHIYPNDLAANVFDHDLLISQKDMVVMAVQKVHNEVLSSGMPHLPIYFTEFNAGFDRGQTDLPYVGPWLAQTIARCDGLVTDLAYWTFSDAFFEEGGVFPRPFYNGFGLFATGSIPKASFNAFKVLSLLGDQRLPLESENALLTKRKDGTIVLAVWNYVLPEHEGDVKTFKIKLNNDSVSLACVHTVDARHGDPLSTWDAMGRPSFPTREQQQELRRRGQLPPAKVMNLVNGEVSLTVQPHGLVIVQFID